MSTPGVFIILHDLAIPILAFATLVLAFLYIIFEGRESGAPSPG